MKLFKTVSAKNIAKYYEESNNKAIEEIKQFKLNNTTIIKNISFNQKEILYNIMQLYNNGNAFDCDMTASQLKFYEVKKADKFVIPEPKYLFDVYPQSEKIKKIEPLGRLPLDDNSIHSIVIDLPFVISPPNAPSAKAKKDGANIISNRFASYYPVDDLYESYYHWISEAYRVLDEDGICVFKCQSTISGGINHNIEEYSYMCANSLGFCGEDKFILEAKARLISQSKYKKQVHARKFTSIFWVFKKKKKKKSKDFDYFDLINKYKDIEESRYHIGVDLGVEEGDKTVIITEEINTEDYGLRGTTEVSQEL